MLIVIARLMGGTDCKVLERATCNRLSSDATLLIPNAAARKNPVSCFSSAFPPTVSVVGDSAAKGLVGGVRVDVEFDLALKRFVGGKGGMVEMGDSIVMFTSCSTPAASLLPGVRGAGSDVVPALLLSEGR
jgi:hypothetical protein